MASQMVSGGVVHLLSGLEGDFRLSCLAEPTGDCFVSHIFALLICFPVFLILFSNVLGGQPICCP